jgi:hypothetical protein
MPFNPVADDIASNPRVRKPMNDSELCGRLLDVIEHDVIPLTRAGVAAGNKLFRAAILRKSDLSLVVADTNGGIEKPLPSVVVRVCAVTRFFGQFVTRL